MKYFFLAIFVFLAAQPMQVSACDMHDSRQASLGDSHNMNHDDGQGMDCCDPEPSTPGGSCESTSHCATCPSGVMAISSVSSNAIFKTHSRVYQPDNVEPLSRFNPPPFKPPIV